MLPAKRYLKLLKYLVTNTYISIYLSKCNIDLNQLISIRFLKMEYYKNKRRKYDIEDVNELLEKNIELASRIHVDIEKCVHPTVLEWLRNDDDLTSGQPLSLYFSIMSTIAHLSIESNVLQ